MPPGRFSGGRPRKSAPEEEAKMSDCDELTIVGVEVDVKSAPHCSRGDAEGDCFNQIFAKCEERRKERDLPKCSSAKDCAENMQCVEYLLAPSLAKITTIVSRDPNCKEHGLHYVSSYKGVAQSACHCEKLVPPAK